MLEAEYTKQCIKYLLYIVDKRSYNFHWSYK